MNMQMNWLLLNEETENGLSAAAEDIGKFQNYFALFWIYLTVFYKI